MEIPDKFKPIIEEILQQLKEFEEAYGTIPRVRLVTQDNYESLVKSLQNQQTKG
ncbi:hypothetical protein [Microseira sp. BLCC-F43]|jgi:hypothetical protein|uniref:hypothetical protein n=1 Tax=Microseira sp. BLCC-F43 TaxID=3153602 RepID=UPI0035BADBF5